MLHVTFGRSACGGLMLALTELGRTEPVTYLFDDFSIGPLDVDLETRAAWFEDMAVLWRNSELAEHNAEIFASIIEADAVTVWMSRLNAYERSGFLEIVRRRHGPIYVVDIADHDMRNGVALQDRSASLMFGFTGPTRIIEKNLHVSAVALDDVARASVLAQWKRVAAENADLRMVESDRLHSVPISYFDEYITSFVRDEWTSHSVVVGAAQANGVQEGKWMNDMLVWDRLIALIESSVLEGEMCGELWDVRASKVRRRS
jgi:Protein of unknown function/Domain of unknown function (DUF1835)